MNKKHKYQIGVPKIPKDKATLENDIFKKIKEVRKDPPKLKNSIFNLKFNQLCEIKVLIELFSQKKCLDFFNFYGIDSVSFFNGEGPDIILYNEKIKFYIEIKGSCLKHDYMNQNEYAEKSFVKFYGNALKVKDFDDNGNLSVDVIILVCCNEEKKGKIKKETEWEYLIFHNKDIQKLKPKASVFFPSYVSRIMIEEKNSYFTDEFCDLKKGIVQIIAKPFIVDKKKISYEDVKKDFLNVWNDPPCFLLQNEHKAIVEHIWENEDSLRNWDKISKSISNKNNITEGNFQWSKLFTKYKCGLIELPKNKRARDNCKRCIDIIRNHSINNPNTREFLSENGCT